jgi:hypothetical protein
VRPEPADVLVIDGRPGRFVWRGRLYTVLAVLQRPVPEGGRSGEDEVGEREAAEGERAMGEAGEGRATGEQLVPPGWRCWRVMAAPGKNVPATSFRLCQEVATDRWLLTRADD